MSPSVVPQSSLGCAHCWTRRGGGESIASSPHYTSVTPHTPQKMSAAMASCAANARAVAKPAIGSKRSNALRRAGPRVVTASSRRHVMTAKAEYKVRNPYSSCNSAYGIVPWGCEPTPVADLRSEPRVPEGEHFAD